MKWKYDTKQNMIFYKTWYSIIWNVTKFTMSQKNNVEKYEIKQPIKCHKG